MNAFLPGDYTLWRGVTNFSTRGDLPGGTCDDFYTTDVAPHACRTWGNLTSVAGRDDLGRHGVHATFDEDNFMEVVRRHRQQNHRSTRGRDAGSAAPHTH